MSSSAESHQPSKRGRFVVLEGVDGSGTTTQLSLLASALRQRGLEVLETREPSRSAVGLYLRELLGLQLRDASGQLVRLSPHSMALLFAADRLEHLKDEVLPALERGAWVLCDRYLLSSLVYQSATAPDAAEMLSFVREINRAALPADLVLVLDVPAEVAEARRAARGGPEELFEKKELQLRLSQLYRQSASLLPGQLVELIAATESPEQVCQLLLEAMDRIWPKSLALD